MPLHADESGFLKGHSPQHPEEGPPQELLRIARETLQMIIPTKNRITPDMITHAFILTPPVVVET
ncbi:MAG TPA: hypothetical protein VIL66_00220 [Bacillota bacterium]